MYLGIEVIFLKRTTLCWSLNPASTILPSTKGHRAADRSAVFSFTPPCRVTTAAAARAAGIWLYKTGSLVSRAESPAETFPIAQ